MMAIKNALSYLGLQKFHQLEPKQSVLGSIWTQIASKISLAYTGVSFAAFVLKTVVIGRHNARQHEKIIGEIPKKTDWTFPNEITDSIFQFLGNSPKDLGQARLVCKKWKEIIDGADYTVQRILYSFRDNNKPELYNPYGSFFGSAAFLNQLASKFDEAIKIAKRLSTPRCMRELREAASKIELPFHRFKIYLQITGATRDSNDLDFLRQEVYECPTLMMAIESLIQIKSLSKDEKDMDAAREIACKNNHPEHRFRNYRTIAEATGDSIDIVSLKSEASKMPMDWQRVECFIQIARITKNETDIEEARVNAKKIENKNLRIIFLMKIADITHNLADFEALRAEAVLIDDNLMRAQALFVIALISQSPEDIDAARKAAALLEKNIDQVDVLIDIAALSLDPSDIETARTATNLIIKDLKGRAVRLIKIEQIDPTEQNKEAVKEAITALREKAAACKNLKNRIAGHIEIVGISPTEENIKIAKIAIALFTKSSKSLCHFRHLLADRLVSIAIKTPTERNINVAKLAANEIIPADSSKAHLKKELLLARLDSLSIVRYSSPAETPSRLAETFFFKTYDEARSFPKAAANY